MARALNVLRHKIARQERWIHNPDLKVKNRKRALQRLRANRTELNRLCPPKPRILP